MKRGRLFCVGGGCERCLGGGKPPPYRTTRKGSVGANSVRPCGLAAVQDCTGRRRLAAHNERRHPAELARSCGSMPHWGIDRCTTPQRRPPTATAKPPLCKGRWHGEAVTEGLERVWACWVVPEGHNPSVSFADSSLYTREPPSTPVEFILAPEGSNGEGPKSVKKNAALLHFLAFGPFDHLFGVPRGRAPWAGVRCLGTARLFSLPFLVTKKEGLTEEAL